MLTRLAKRKKKEEYIRMMVAGGRVSLKKEDYIDPYDNGNIAVWDTIFFYAFR